VGAHQSADLSLILFPGQVSSMRWALVDEPTQTPIFKSCWHHRIINSGVNSVRPCLIFAKEIRPYCPPDAAFACRSWPRDLHYVDDAQPASGRKKVRDIVFHTSMPKGKRITMPMRSSASIRCRAARLTTMCGSAPDPRRTPAGYRARCAGGRKPSTAYHPRWRE